MTHPAFRYVLMKLFLRETMVWFGLTRQNVPDANCVWKPVLTELYTSMRITSWLKSAPVAPTYWIGADLSTNQDALMLVQCRHLCSAKSRNIVLRYLRLRH